MVWNTNKSILGTGELAKDVTTEADVIFTAAFLGTAAIQSKKHSVPWRVDIEEDMESARAEARTENDQTAMAEVNHVCFTVNGVLGRKAIGWGFTPSFARGGMILGGRKSVSQYKLVNRQHAAFAFRYLTAAHRAASDDKRNAEMYIGRGAYCGLVIDGDGGAVTAMSTVRTTFRETTPGVGDRWLPPLDAPVRAEQYAQEPQQASWGLIGGTAVQQTLRQQGMRFFPQPDGQEVPLDAKRDVIGYTHGMIRSMYEVERIGTGSAFEMSIGTSTFKLASCVPCSTFMIANDDEASSTHLGRGESWTPLISGASNTASHLEDAPGMTIDLAIQGKNAKHSAFMHTALEQGVTSMLAAREWVEESHHSAVEALAERLKTLSTAENSVARDLFLDALTVHSADVKRLKRTLTVAPGRTRDAVENDSYLDTWHGRTTKFSDDEIAALHTLPDATYRIVAWSDEGAECDLDVLLTEGDSEHYRVKLQPSSIPGRWIHEFTRPSTVDVENWTIKIGRAVPHRVELDRNVAVDGRHWYYFGSLSK